MFFSLSSQVVGTDLGTQSVSLFDVPRTTPTILVLGNEGHGIRTNILRRCTHLVRIGDHTTVEVAEGSNDVSGEQEDVESNRIVDQGESDELSQSDAVDSLNVSVTGAIILHHFLSTPK